MAGGRQTLILVSDDNFGSTQFTHFLALSLGGLAGLRLLRRR